MAAQHQSKLKTKPFFIVSKPIAVLACFIILISLTCSKKCAIDSDCGIGNKCQKVQECDDFGCKPPTFECFQTDDISFSSGFSDDSSSTTKTSTSSGGTTVAHVQEAGTSSTGSGDKRPSRLIIRTQNTEKSILRLDSTADSNLAYEIVMNPNNGKLEVTNTHKTMMAFNKNGTEIDCSDNINFKTYEMEINSVWKFTQGHLKFEGVPQWKLIHDEIFKYGSYAEGWSLPEATTKCGAVHMLGGYCKTSSEHLAKTFSELPVHKRIRIQANFHFIDSWGGDTAYLRVSEEDDMKDLNYVWTESYDYVSSRNAINVCGRDIGDGKFNVFIDVELAHTHNQIKLLFGSSLEQDSCSASYGISSIRIYVI